MATSKKHPTPTAPDCLTPRAQRLWQAIIDDYDLPPSQLEMLRQALESLSRADRAACVVEEQGMTVTDRYGCIRQHPMLDVELRNRATFARLMTLLKLHTTTERPHRPGRPAAGDTRRDPRLRLPVTEVQPRRERPRLA